MYICIYVNMYVIDAYNLCICNSCVYIYIYIWYIDINRETWIIHILVCLPGKHILVASRKVPRWDTIFIRSGMSWRWVPKSLLDSFFPQRSWAKWPRPRIVPWTMVILIETRKIGNSQAYLSDQFAWVQVASASNWSSQFRHFNQNTNHEPSYL